MNTPAPHAPAPPAGTPAVQAPGPRPGTDPGELLTVLRDAHTTLTATHDPRPGTGTRTGWAQTLTATQHLINTATAIQHHAMTALAAIEPHQRDDGTETETHRTPGHQALDAPAIIAGALTLGQVHATHRVTNAVRLAADGPPGTTTNTGLGALHHAMRTGTLDPYRASVIADELDLAPPEVADTVITTLTPRFATDTAVQLRRLTRRTLAALCPDLLRERATRARKECGLHRWADQPGTDHWEGTFPSEDAIRAWAAIDALAQKLVKDGTCERIDHARAQALIDLVTGNATIETTIILTTPDDTTPTDTPDDDDGGHDDSHDDSGDPDTGGSDDDDSGNPDTGSSDDDDRSDDESPAASNDASTGRCDAGNEDATGSQTPAPAEPARPSTRDTHPTPPHPAPPDPPPPPAEAAPQGPLGKPASNTNRTAAATSADDLVEVAHPRGGEPLLIPRAWLHALLTQPSTTTRARPCHPITGALLDHTTHPGYRPPDELAAVVRQRDGRCRFPGCHVAARFTDLDHVTPWPTGPTTATNLICLCRRHHRIKQRPGWAVRLTPDGTTHWTDPTGHTRTTHPIDTLHPITLPAPATTSAGATDTAGVSGTARSPDRGQPPPTNTFSALEFTLEHLLAPAAACRTRTPYLDRRNHPDPHHDPTTRLEYLDTQPRTHRRPYTRTNPWRDLPDDPPF